MSVSRRCTPLVFVGLYHGFVSITEIQQRKVYEENLKTLLSQRETPLKNWPPVEWHFIQKKTAPASFEFPALEDVPGLNPCSILEYRLHECQIQTIQRPSKMIVNTVRRMIDAFQFTSG